MCVSHFVQTDFLGTSKRVCVLSSQNDPLPRIMNRILSLTGEHMCYFIQTDLLYDISSGKYPLTGLFMLFCINTLMGTFYQESTPYGGVVATSPFIVYFIRKIPLTGRCVSHFVQTDFLGTSKRVCVCVLSPHIIGQNT